MKNLFVVVGLLVVVAGGYFFLNSRSSNTEDTSMTKDTMESEEVMMEDNEVESEMPIDGDSIVNETQVMNEYDYTMELDNYSFSPSVIEAKAGGTVTIKLVSLSNMHDFVIDELDVQSSALGNGDEEVIEINIPEDAEGEYEFYCSIGSHRQLGMVGILKVVSE